MQGYVDHRRADAPAMGAADDAGRAGRACWWSSGSGSRADRQWASTGFYFFGLILGILVISQFWTLANEVLRPAAGQAHLRLHRRRRQPRRHRRVSRCRCRPSGIGTTNLLLVSAALMTVCLVLVVAIIKREKPEIKGSLTGGEDEGVSSTRGAAAAEEQQAPADHRAHHRVCRHRRGHRRAAAEHGDRGRPRARATPTRSPASWARCSSTRRSSGSSSRCG